MASNACLVTNSASELREMTENHVEIPTYGSPYDARKLCKALLKDDSRRRDIVGASQKYVRENALWEHRFKDIEQITGVKLLNGAEKPGRFCALNTPYCVFPAPAPAKPVIVDRYANRRKIMNFEFNLLKKYQFFMEFTKKKTKAKEEG